MSVDTDQVLRLSSGQFQDYVTTLPSEQIGVIQSKMQSRMADIGQYLMQQGEVSDFMLFIEEGAVEVIVGDKNSKPVSYLGRGDVIGDLGMLNQQPRSAHIRASSPVVYKVIAAQDFKLLMAEVPGFATFFAGRMARMVKGSKPSRQHNSTCTDLRGKLPDFDLLAVLYTISSSGSSGELSIMDHESSKLGNLFIREGIVTYAEFRSLFSAEACYQMLSEQLFGSFSFELDAQFKGGSHQAGAVTISIEKLVQKATEIREELVSFPAPMMALEGS